MKTHPTSPIRPQQILLLLSTTVVTVCIALGIIRWWAPQLLGVPADLRLVQVSDEVPPFFEGVFRREDFSSQAFIINDPFIQRAKPLMPAGDGVGPHDLLGFRNASIPHRAAIITIGDSQTYGNNAPLDKNWPSQLQRCVRGGESTLYNMSVGGWGAIEYLQIFEKALYLRPEIVVVAFYTGNDPYETFWQAYAKDEFVALRPNQDLADDDIPPLNYPPPAAEQIAVVFDDGTQTVFTPQLRFASNQDDPAIDAAYALMSEVARIITGAAADHGVRALFTIIPTKELAFARKVADQEKDLGYAPYDRLIAAESARLDHLADQIRAIPGAQYVDVLSPLQQAVLTQEAVYPSTSDGHPLAAGYGVIAASLAREPVKLSNCYRMRHRRSWCCAVRRDSIAQVSGPTRSAPRTRPGEIFPRDRFLGRDT